jgi:uncharacterized membrane protein YphA (DoxX/SURF4 family)
VILIRLLVGLVFFEEGLQKLLFPSVMGAGRFARIGIPAPDALGPFVGVVEIVCGAMLVLGLLTRLATVPLLVDITVAILSTKVPIPLGHGYGPFTLPQLSRYGFWSAASEGRTELCDADGAAVSADRRRRPARPAAPPGIGGRRRSWAARAPACRRGAAASPSRRAGTAGTR